MQLPTRIGKYELQEFLGGGMSHVYRAWDTVIGRSVAVKVLTEAACRDEAARGRTFIWYTTENDEFFYCDKTYVFRSGRVTRELSASECTEEALLAASFEEPVR